MKSSKYIKVVKQENDEFHIALTDEFTLVQIKEIYQEVQKLGKNPEKKFFITLKEMKSLDLTGIQLIISLKKTLESMDKIVNIDLEYPEEVKDLLIISGFSEL